MNSCVIIIADDDDDDREFFKEALDAKRSAGLLQFADGEKLIKGLENMDTLPSIIFLDLNMPLKDGIECLQEIRANEKLKDIPIAIYTTSSNTLHIDRTYESGANLYIIKPTEYKKIEKMIDMVLSLDPNHYLPQPPRDIFVLFVE